MNLEVIYFTRKEHSKISVKSRKKIGRTIFNATHAKSQVIEKKCYL